MKSFIFLCCAFIFFCIPSFSQEKEWEWSIQSFSTGNNFTYDMVTDEVNNSYFTGFYDPVEFQIGDSVFFCQDGEFNAFVSSFDRNGNFRWAVSFQKAPESLYGTIFDCYLAVDSQQNLYVAGNFSFSIDFGDTLFYSEGYWDVFIAKYDSSGQFIWAYHINGPTSNDNVTDIEIDGMDNLYLSISHARHGFDNTVVFGNNDTTITFHNCCGSVLSLNSDASFSWLSCGTSELDVEYDNLMIDKENNIYVQLYFLEYMLFNGDTIEADLSPYTHLVIPFDTNGQPGEYHKFPHYWITEMVIDGQGDFIATGVINESLIILGDTLNPASYDFLLVKYNHQLEPEWYNTFSNSSSMNNFVLDLDKDDGIYISAPFTGELVLADTVLQSGGMNALFIAKLNSSGDVSWASIIPGSDFLYSNVLNLDHCGNVLVCGGFNGEIYLGTDTLIAQNMSEVMLAKLSNELGFLDLGNDTVACGSLLLSSPEGYQYYSWNDGASNEDHFLVTETGTYSLLAVNEYYCTDMDSIFVEISSVSQVDLGNDTLIYISDSLHFSLDTQFDFIMWSDGSTGMDYMFKASDFGEGFHLVVVMLDEDGCYHSDSISIHVVDNSYLEEQKWLIENLYPNPARDKLYFTLSHSALKRDINLVAEIIDLNGQTLISQVIDSPNGFENQRIVLDISLLVDGMYFLLLKEGRIVISEKKFIVSN